MFSSKNANDFKTKAKSNVERKLNFAKLYYLYKEYDAALNYVTDYLRHREDSASAHKVLAQIYEATGEGQKALDSYQKSLEYDINQDDVLLKICKLLVSYPSDSDTMRFWIEKAERCFPNQEVVIRLKDCVEDADRILNGNNTVNDESNIVNSNYTYYSTPLSERFWSPKSSTKNKNINSNVERMDEKFFSIVKGQEELLKCICNQQDMLLKSNEAIVNAIKEGNSNFLNLQLKLDKINSTLEEIYLLKNLSFSKKQDIVADDINSGYDIRHDTNPTFTETANEGNENTGFHWTPQNQDNTSGAGFAVKFKNCDISEAFQKAIHGAKGFHESSENTMHSLPDWTSANAPAENIVCDVASPVDLSNGSNVHFGIGSSADIFGRSKDMTSSSIYPQSLFPSNLNASGIASSNVARAENSQPDTRPLSEVFKGQQKCWQCEFCYVQNDDKLTSCLACESSRPGFTNKPAPTKETSFSFGIPSTSTPAQTSNSVKANTFTFDISQTPGAATSFRFGDSPVQSAPKSPSKPFSFSAALKETQQSAFHFGSSQDFSFKFGGVSNSPVNVKSPKQLQEAPNSPEDYNESLEHSNDDSIHFKPLIPLPPKIDVKTGEENEAVLFNERAKLYRYVNAEWKERGIGDIKILHDAVGHHVRLLMRRDQVLKVCLNHQISKDFVCTPKGNLNDEGGVKSFQWKAVDYSEGTPISEVFAIRFKNSSIAENFRKTIEESKLLLDNVGSNVEDVDLEIIYEKKPQSENVLQRAQKLKLPVNFYDYENAKPCPGCRGCKDLIPVLNYELRSAENNDVDENEATNSNLFTAAIAEQGKSFTWSNNAQSTASWVTNKPTPIFGASNEDNDNDNANDSNEGKDFKPVIPLPDLVETKTGEEDEIAVFSQRAKLYRYDEPTKQWKERGVGEFKILKHNAKALYRLLLRRDQVLKIACNHYLLKDMTFSPMPNSENAVCWCAVDYSDENPVSEKLAIKFKNKSILGEFLAKIEEAKRNL